MWVPSSLVETEGPNYHDTCRTEPRLIPGYIHVEAKRVTRADITTERCVGT